MKLSDAELEIMEKVWELGAPVTAAQLTERMAEKGWKPSTLLTFLARMVNKGALEVEKQGKQNLYRALVSAEDYRAQAAGSCWAAITAAASRAWWPPCTMERASPTGNWRNCGPGWTRR